MKSILYVGATLMIGASIYGFVDFKQTKEKKEFKSMYTEKKETVPIVNAEIKTTSPEVKKESAKQAAVLVVKNDKILAGVKPIPVDQQIKKTTVDLKSIADENEIPIKEKVVVKKKRKFSIKEFSRAPLRDDIDEELLLPEKKISIKKIETKEQ